MTREHSERSPLPGERQPVPDFTVPFLVSFGVVLFIGLVTLWAAMGYLAALASALAADVALRALDRRT